MYLASNLSRLIVLLVFSSKVVNSRLSEEKCYCLVCFEFRKYLGSLLVYMFVCCRYEVGTRYLLT